MLRVLPYFAWGIGVIFTLFSAQTAVFAQTSSYEIYPYEQEITSTPREVIPPLITDTSSINNGDSFNLNEDPFLLNSLSRVLHLGDLPLPQIAGNLINLFLSLLTIIFVFLMLSAGAQLMFSGGNEERAVGARKTFINAIVGLILILASYSIVRFLLQAFMNVTTGSTSPTL